MLHLKIKEPKFEKLALVDGPIERNSKNHVLKSVDSFANLYIFNFSVTKDYLNSLTNGKSFNGLSFFIYDNPLIIFIPSKSKNLFYS